MVTASQPGNANYAAGLDASRTFAIAKASEAISFGTLADKTYGDADFGVTVDGHETFGLSVFFRDGDSIFRTYFTSGRGVETLGTSWTFLDVTPLGRQETWEDSPAGYPQSPA